MKKFQNIYIASDIDGTFTWEYNHTSERNFEKLKYFNENGGHFCFSTGRNNFDTAIVVPRWKEICTMPCILCNGGFMYDAVAGKIINPRFLEPSERAREVFFDVIDNFGDIAGVRVSAPEGFIVCKNDSIAIENLKSMNVSDDIINIKERADIDGRNWFKAVIRVDPEKRDMIRDFILEKYNEFSLTYSAPILLEIQPFGVSKAYQLKVLEENIKKENPNAVFYCIGDYENDYEMLKTADIAVCPENATDRIKSICQKQVCHCKDGAVADLIDMIDDYLS